MDVNHVIIQGLTRSEHYAIFNSTASKFVEVESVRGARKLPASLPLSMARTGVQWPLLFAAWFNTFKPVKVYIRPTWELRKISFIPWFGMLGSV